ncbi:sensor histidine kinase [Dyadobacter frigoris]|uniref:histidine kinase n=1 Tax=Dyadobacter frigoris TaxID=2576211 RepID=A0A4U6D1Z9_9BACT|nr:HAMP domain-containing sensor histidine kinase [Dyadobacter frigoris]TKT90295.1 HAMP domain-containing histidine kinase [Dyadobacter frigoris]GLU52530.1 two-component sensor histidine kinase [Dyadobacter frigoris]
MRLLLRILRYQLVTSMIVLFLGAGLFYVSVRYLIDREANKELFQSQVKVRWQLRHLDTLPVYILQLGDSLQLQPVAYPGRPFMRETSMLNLAENEYQPYRQLVFYERALGQWYRITISKMLLQRQRLLETVVMTITFIVALLLISLLLLNSWLSERLWKPFYKTLGKLDHYQIQQHETLQFKKEETLEFDQLNHAVTQLTERIAAAYQNLKEFTENASHEIQTPLAVILSKIEGLFQDETLTESQLVTLSSVSEAANRLGRLNQALLLLTKIENRQFLAGTDPVNLVPIINGKLRDLEDLIVQRKINIQTDLEPVGLVIHPALAEILVNNLLTNAIRHNVENGKIIITLRERFFSVKNTGKILNLNPERLFERFRKESTASASLGLGLALVKTICEVNGQNLKYDIDNEWHTLTVSW